MRRWGPNVVVLQKKPKAFSPYEKVTLAFSGAAGLAAFAAVWISMNAFHEQAASNAATVRPMVTIYVSAEIAILGEPRVSDPKQSTTTKPKWTIQNGGPGTAYVFWTAFSLPKTSRFYYFDKEGYEKIVDELSEHYSKAPALYGGVVRALSHYVHPVLSGTGIASGADVRILELILVDVPDDDAYTQMFAAVCYCDVKGTCYYTESRRPVGQPPKQCPPTQPLEEIDKVAPMPW